MREGKMDARRIPVKKILGKGLAERTIGALRKRLIYALLTTFPLAASTSDAVGSTPEQWVDEHLPGIVSLYQDLHRNPELSFREEKTSPRLAHELREVGATVTENVGGFGVVAVMENGAGKVLMLRADMDGLPVVEETGLPYASKVRVTDDRGATVGVMHACGHEIHMANLIGVARFLSQNRPAWRGTLLFVCQPAEERGAGAEAMLADGLFARFPRPDFAVALHVGHDLPTGAIGYRAGYALANVDSVDITVRGRGGHGAYPHTTIDPIVIAARIVLDLQTIVSREVKPTEPAVITVGSIHGGTKHNIIGDDCHLQITVRSYTPAVRKQLHEGIRRVAVAAAAVAGAPEPEVKISQGTPSLYNDPQLTERVAGTLRRVLGNLNVVDAEPSMGGEDFSRYGEAGVPICMFRLGAVRADRLKQFASRGAPPPSLHSPLFYPDAEETLQTGVIALASITLNLLNDTDP